MDASQMSGATLAYLGDAVIEVMTRKRLLMTGIADSGRLNEMARAYVTAKAQSDAVERILPVLTEEEEAVYRRGRNARVTAIPKSANAGQYHRATGIEALFAFLYLEDRQERLAVLFDAAYPDDPPVNV